MLRATKTVLQITQVVLEVPAVITKATAAVTEITHIGCLVAGRRRLVAVGSVTVRAVEAVGAMLAVQGLEVGSPTATKEMIDAGDCCE